MKTQIPEDCPSWTLRSVLGQICRLSLLVPKINFYHRSCSAEKDKNIFILILEIPTIMIKTKSQQTTYFAHLKLDVD